MKKKLIASVAAAALLASPLAAAQEVHVAVSQIVEHPALDACRNGLKAGLADAGGAITQSSLHQRQRVEALRLATG